MHKSRCILKFACKVWTLPDWPLSKIYGRPGKGTSDFIVGLQNLCVLLREQLAYFCWLFFSGFSSQLLKSCYRQKEANYIDRPASNHSPGKDTLYFSSYFVSLYVGTWNHFKDAFYHKKTQWMFIIVFNINIHFYIYSPPPHRQILYMETS